MQNLDFAQNPMQNLDSAQNPTHAMRACADDSECLHGSNTQNSVTGKNSMVLIFPCLQGASLALLGP